MLFSLLPEPFNYLFVVGLGVVLAVAFLVSGKVAQVLKGVAEDPLPVGQVFKAISMMVVLLWVGTFLLGKNGLYFLDITLGLTVSAVILLAVWAYLKKVRTSGH